MSSVSEPSWEELRAWDREIVWHSFTQMAEYEPLLIERGQGCMIYDSDGNGYLDGVSSIWCNVHGHRHPTINAGIKSQLDKIAHTTNLGASNSTTIKLAKRLVDLAPGDLNHVFFSGDGASALEVALKMAFQYWRQCPEPKPNKNTFVALESAYHGDTLGDVSVGGVKLFHQMFQPLLFEVHRVPSPNPYRPPEGVSAEETLSYCLGEAERVLAAHHERIAAFVLEPLMQGAAGMIAHPPGYLRGVRELTAKYGVLLIADEVAVGMGRTGKMFACEHEEVVPDFLCLAKGLTGGYLPLAATIARTEIWNAFLGPYEAAKHFFHGHTYGGNPLGAAAGLATLQVFEDEQTLQEMQPKIVRLSEHLARIKELPPIGNVRQCGLMVGVELVRDKQTKEPLPWAEKWGARVCLEARRHGVLLRPLGNVVVVMPPLNISLDDLDHLLVALERSIEAVCVDSPVQG